MICADFPAYYQPPQPEPGLSNVRVPPAATAQATPTPAKKARKTPPQSKSAKKGGAKGGAKGGRQEQPE